MIVVGAGMAGLSAAAALSAGGLSVRVLEARDRAGGRVWTLRPPEAPLPVELGAEFVHGKAPSTARLARAAGAKLIDLHPSHWRLRKQGLTEQGEEDALARTLRRAGKEVPKRGDVSFAEALRRAGVDEPARTRALAFVEGFHASDAKRISARALADEDADEPLRRVAGGYWQLVDELRDRLPRGCLRFGVEVRRIRWTPGAVEIAGHRARAAIVAVPVEMLRDGPARRNGSTARARIDIDPGLEEKQRALASFATGDVVRVELLFRDALWQDRALVRAPEDAELDTIGFLHAEKSPIPTWWTRHPFQAPLITGWAGGRAATRFLSGGGRLADRAFESLARALGIDSSVVRRRCVATWSHDWSADPHSLGAYTYPLVGADGAARALAAPVEKTLFFAGEATADPPHNATVEGALQSGERAAREILRALG